MTVATGLCVASLCALLVSVGVTAAALVYARRRGLVDLPGRRRSHTHPTPRGGGIGIVAGMLLVGVPAWRLLDAGGWRERTAFVVAIAAVALVGWRDDHGPLPVWPRIAVHAGAALLIAAGVLSAWAGAPPQKWWGLLPLAVVLVGFINAHNFMDGIDGILGQQGLFVMLGFGLLGAWAGDIGIAGLAFAAAAACLGFLMFNAPPARIFMGDVGSGSLGLAIGGVGALLARRDAGLLWPCLILPSVFLVDSGLTLAWRVLAGQRWYAPHRQHLYQWLVRVHWSHARTDVAYMTWNLAVVAPAAWVALQWPAYGPWCCIGVYVTAFAAWHVGKRACIASVRRSVVREVA